MTLQANTTLQGGKYIIKKVLGQGGFGITYLAENTMLDGNVAIKEFFMKELCERDESTSHVTLGTSSNCEMVERCRQKFLKEARTIFRLIHPNIVRILDVFEENGTAYYVMEYIEGESLADMVKRRGALPEAEALDYIFGVGEALMYIHEHRINHLDIKPSNIMRRREDGQIMLIDFGVSKQYDLVTSEGTSTTPVGISRGYSPAEQYRQNGVQTFSPQSDVYAMAATLYKLLTGVTPPEAMEVQDEGLPVDELQKRNISASVIDIIVKAMKGRRERTQSVMEFLTELSDSQINENNEDNYIEENSSLEEDTCINEFQPKEEQQTSLSQESEVPESDISEYVQTKIPEKEPQEMPLKTIWILLGIVVALIFIVKMSVTKGDSNNTAAIAVSEKSTISFDNGLLIYNGVHYKMIHVKEGIFMMGATPEMENPYSDEKPVHQVALSSYSIGETEVTQALWKAVMGSNPSTWKGDNLPVEQVSWNDCQEFIRKLNAASGKIFRLPTEAEWEYASRGGNLSRGFQYSGSNNLEEVAWSWHDYKSGHMTRAVGTKQANELGLYDMSGNVWEWCSDWYGEYSSSTQTNPKGPQSGTYRVIRGGDWDDYTRDCRSSSRSRYNPIHRGNDLGFRLVLSE